MNQSTTRAFRSRVGMRTILATALLALCARIAPAIAHSNEAAAAFAPIVDQTLITMASDRRSFSFRSQYVEHVKPIYSVRVYERG